VYFLQTVFLAILPTGKIINGDVGYVWWIVIYLFMQKEMKLSDTLLFPDSSVQLIGQCAYTDIGKQLFSMLLSLLSRNSPAFFV